MSRWYRAYAGTVTDDKLAEAALVAGCSRSVVIATWHAILESCATTQGKGEFQTTARRVAAILAEPLEMMERIFSLLNDIGLISGNVVCAWTKRQFESDSSTERSRRYRASRRNDDATLQQQHAASPSVCVSVSEDIESLEEEVEPNPRAREPSRYDEIQDAISSAAGEMPCAASSDIAPIVRLVDQGWSLEGHILPGIRELSRAGKRAGTWLYVANTLVGKAADARAGPPPAAKQETASDRFARTLKARKNGDSRSDTREVH